MAVIIYILKILTCTPALSFHATYRNVLTLTSLLQEPHIMATESDENMDYHIYIKSECLVTVNFVADASADLIY